MNRQDEILKYLKTVESAKLDEIYQNVSFSYYHNAHKHLGAILSNMVKNGKIERIKKGVFKVSSTPPRVRHKSKQESKLQQKLF